MSHGLHLRRLGICECRVVVKIFKGSFQKPMFGLIWVTNTIPPCREIRIIVRLLAQSVRVCHRKAFNISTWGHNFHIINNYKSHMCLKAQNIWFRHKNIQMFPENAQLWQFEKFNWRESEIFCNFWYNTIRMNLGFTSKNVPQSLQEDTALATAELN